MVIKKREKKLTEGLRCVSSPCCSCWMLVVVVVVVVVVVCSHGHHGCHHHHHPLGCCCDMANMRVDMIKTKNEKKYILYDDNNTCCCCCCCCCCHCLWCGNRKVRWQLLPWWWTLVVDKADEEWHRKKKQHNCVKINEVTCYQTSNELVQKKIPPWLAWQATTTTSSLLLTTTANTSNIKIGPRDINNFSWVIGMFFLFY